MIESEIEELLGAYALDAVELSERIEIEGHLAHCPRCRAEVSAHREVAAILANGSASVPEGLWDRIASEISPSLPENAIDPNVFASRLSRVDRSKSRHSKGFLGAMVGVAAVAVLVSLLSLQIVNLNSQLGTKNGVNVGIRSLVTSALAHPHQTLTLDSATKKGQATIILGTDHNAYWINSDLSQLPPAETYQLWAIVRGKIIVSLGVIGPDPRTTSRFRVEPDTSKIMVTVEPEGGTVLPTTPVLASSAV